MCLKKGCLVRVWRRGQRFLGIINSADPPDDTDTINWLVQIQGQGLYRIRVHNMDILLGPQKEDQGLSLLDVAKKYEIDLSEFVLSEGTFNQLRGYPT